MLPEVNGEVFEALQFPQMFCACLQFRGYMKFTEQHTWPSRGPRL